MPEYIVDVIYTSRGYMLVAAKNEDKAREKALAFDCAHDEVMESSFEEVLLETLALNE